MIQASDIFARVVAHLDDHNSGRYTEAADLVPALNSAVEYLTTVFSAGFERKKIFPETLTELTKVALLSVTGTGQTRKVDVTTIYPNMWTIFGVEPNPITAGDPAAFSETRNKMATRLTIEEWNDKAEDPFSPGTTIGIPNTFIRTAYTGPGAYFEADHQYIFIRPGSVFEGESPKVVIWYLLRPTVVVSGATVLAFPVSLFGWLVTKTLNYLSMQHGPESKYGPVTEKELMSLIGLINS